MALFLQLTKHIDRLFTGAKKIDLVLPFTKNELKERLYKLMKENEIETGNIYFQVTRGIAIPRDHSYPDPIKVPAVFYGVNY